MVSMYLAFVTTTWIEVIGKDYDETPWSFVHAYLSVVPFCANDAGISSISPERSNSKIEMGTCFGKINWNDN